jgi:hypothetical protein
MTLFVSIAFTAFGRFSGRSMLFFYGAPLAAFAGALWMRLHPRNYIEADPSSGKAKLVERGNVVFETDSTNLGPLKLFREQRTQGSGSKKRTVTYYGVRTSSNHRFPAVTQEMRARFEGERIARLLRVDLISLSGELRPLAALDMPLYERLRADAAAKQPATAPAAAHVQIRNLMPGYEITTTYRSKAPFAAALAGFLFPLGLVLFHGGFPLLGRVVRGDASAFDYVAGALIALLFSPFVYGLYAGVRASFFPGEIRITTEELRYRRHRLSIDEIEEIDGPPDAPPRFITDRGTVTISNFFCPSKEFAYLGHEIRRALLEVGQIRRISRSIAAAS